MIEDLPTRCVSTRPTIIGRHRIHSPGCWSSGYVFFPEFSLFLPSLAVRKNRYVILPIDFEEAWKVSCLFGLIVVHPNIFLSLALASKRSRGQMKLTSSVRAAAHLHLLCLILSLSTLDR